MLWTTLNHLGGSWKSAHEGANFAASLFYDRISRVSKWSFPSVVSRPTQNLCIGQVVHRLSLHEIFSAPSGASKRHKRQGRRTPTGLAPNKSKGQKALRMADRGRGLGIVGV